MDINLTIETYEQRLLEQLLNLIEQSKKQVAIQVNSELTLLFWQVGKHINEYVLQNQRADYGKRIFPTLSIKLQEKYGRNFEEKNLRRMSQFAEQFGDYKIVVPLARQLSWSHFLILLPLKNREAQLFYAQKAVQEAWGKRELRSQINQKVFERTTIANSQLPITETLIAPNIFKDPYFLEFLGLKNDYLENDLENAILRELEQFILELGRGFAFVERQKRMIIDGEDFYLDLLFYHRKLKRLVAIELKIGKFQAKFKGHRELYLKWLNRYERQEGEEAPIGLILCAEASHEQIELLEMHKDGIIVAEYWTELPPKHELEAKLQQALLEAKERIENRRLLE